MFRLSTGLLNLTFEILYDADVLSAEAFEVWQKSEGPKESQQGKGKCFESSIKCHNVLKIESLLLKASQWLAHDSFSQN